MNAPPERESARGLGGRQGAAGNGQRGNDSTPNDSDSGLRRPPSFMEYGSDLLGLERVKLMSLAERGLLATMRWHLWANDTMPADPVLMARVLGIDADDIKSAMTDRVLSFFAPVEGNLRLFSPELAAQMKHLIERRAERADSGRRGGKSAQAKRKSIEAKPEAELQATRKLAEQNRVKNRTELAGATVMLRRWPAPDAEFLAELDAAERLEKTEPAQ